MSRRPTASQERMTWQTYFGLRYGLVILSAMLYIGVLIQWLYYHCSQGSISAYYFTPVRPVLIASLSAIGVSLIVYRAKRDLENSVLDVAGFLAIIVAFVPTSTPAPGTGCNASNTLLSPELTAGIAPEATRAIEQAYTSRLNDDIMIAIANSVTALFVAALLGILTGRLIKPIPGTRRQSGRIRGRSSGLAVLALLAVGVAAYFLLDAATFRRLAHPTAAITFFALILFVMGLNAVDEKTAPAYRHRYWGIVAMTVVAMAVIGSLHDRIAWTFWLETAGILGFAAFWLVQSNELVGAADRDELVELSAPGPER
jgi:hypothetical protein